MGLYIGGTGSDNFLEDYEEGSWTPVVLGWDTFSPYSGSSYYAGWYVKVGGLVSFSGFISTRIVLPEAYVIFKSIKYL